MGGIGESKKNDALPSSSYSELADVKLLVESPILFFVLSHRAVDVELVQIRRIAVEALDTGSRGGELVDELSRRFHFLKLVYKYHCAAEDEVIKHLLTCGL